MASRSINWDEVLITQDPKKKEVVVSFPADGFGYYGSLTAGSGSMDPGNAGSPSDGTDSGSGSGSGSNDSGVSVGVEEPVIPENPLPECSPHNCDTYDNYRLETGNQNAVYTPSPSNGSSSTNYYARRYFDMPGYANSHLLVHQDLSDSNLWANDFTNYNFNRARTNLSSGRAAALNTCYVSKSAGLPEQIFRVEDYKNPDEKWGHGSYSVTDATDPSLLRADNLGSFWSQADFPYQEYGFILSKTTSSTTTLIFRADAEVRTDGGGTRPNIITTAIFLNVIIKRNGDVCIGTSSSAPVFNTGQDYGVAEYPIFIGFDSIMNYGIGRSETGITYSQVSGSASIKINGIIVGKKNLITGGNGGVMNAGNKYGPRHPARGGMMPMSYRGLSGGGVTGFAVAIGASAPEAMTKIRQSMTNYTPPSYCEILQ